MCIATQAVVG